MKVLVYGAGVLGCELASVLCRGKAHVTLLARGAWKKTLDQNGLLVRHVLQFQTTCDQVLTIDHLEPHWIFDLIFVVLPANCLPEVLPELAANLSHHIVFIGNNAAPVKTEQELLARTTVKKEIAFGFLSAVGHRDGTRIICLHKGVTLTIGSIGVPLSDSFQKMLHKAAGCTDLRYLPESQMAAWLKCRLVLLLPLCFSIYAQKGHMKKITSHQQALCLDAALESCLLLRALGVPINACGDEANFYPGPTRSRFQKLLWLLVHTRLGPLCIGNRAMQSVDEIRCLDQFFKDAQHRLQFQMPAWEELRKEACHFLVPAHRHHHSCVSL